MRILLVGKFGINKIFSIIVQTFGRNFEEIARKPKIDFNRTNFIKTLDSEIIVMSYLGKFSQICVEFE